MFRSKQTTNKVARNIFRGFELRTKVRLMSGTPIDRIKGKCCVFSGHKQKNKLCLLYLQRKLEQDSYG